MNAISSKLKTYSNLSYFLILVPISYGIYQRLNQLLDSIALSGFSPIAYVYRSIHAENFLRDIEAGVQLFDKSFIMKLYVLAFEYFDITPEVLIFIFIFLELIVSSLVIIFLCRSVAKTSSPLFAVTCTLFFVFSNIRNLDLARFGFLYIGQFYIFADSARLLAFAFLFNNRIKSSYIFAVISFAIHPSIGLISLLCISSTHLLFSIKDRTLISFSIINVLTLASCALWTFFNFDKSSLGGSSIPTDSWVALSRLFNFHWYPVDMGMFSKYHYERFFPICTLLMISCLIWKKSLLSPRVKQTIFSIFCITIPLSIFGVIFSELSTSPFLHKLSLHRSSDLTITFAALFILSFVMEKDSSRHLIVKLICFSGLVQAFFSPSSPPILYPGLILIYEILRNKERPSTYEIKVKLMILCALASFVLIYLVIYGFQNIFSPAYSGNIYIAGVLLGLTSIYSLRPTIFVNLRIIVVLVAMMSSINWIKSSELIDSYLKKAGDYRATQVWAKENTPFNSLFAPDPTIFYGWRDFSHRSSFGNIREWLHTNWLYNSNFGLYKEGLRRAKALGIDYTEFLGRSPSNQGYFEMLPILRKRFYNFDSKLHCDLKNEFNIQYFVFDKEHLNDSKPPVKIFENRHFFIVESNKFVKCSN